MIYRKGPLFFFIIDDNQIQLQCKNKSVYCPYEYINRKRIQQAHILILTNTGSMKEIAAKTGFSDRLLFQNIQTIHRHLSLKIY